MLINTEIAEAVVNGTAMRVPILKNITPGMKYHFKVEDKDILSEWDAFIEEAKSLISSTDKEIGFEGTLYYKLIYLIYFFGLFFKYNGSKKDAKYAEACYMFVSMYYSHGSEIDQEKLFFLAFPKSI